MPDRQDHQGSQRRGAGHSTGRNPSAKRRPRKPDRMMLLIIRGGIGVAIGMAVLVGAILFSDWTQSTSSTGDPSATPAGTSSRGGAGSGGGATSGEESPTITIKAMNFHSSTGQDTTIDMEVTNKADFLIESVSIEVSTYDEIGTLLGKGVLHLSKLSPGQSQTGGLSILNTHPTKLHSWKASLLVVVPDNYLLLEIVE